MVTSAEDNTSPPLSKRLPFGKISSIIAFRIRSSDPEGLGIEQYFSKRGYTVLLVSETATELMSSGLFPTICNSNYDYQRTQIMMQKEKEKIYEDAAKHLKNTNILIVCD